MGEGGALPFSLPSFPFSPETPDTQANSSLVLTSNIYIVMKSPEENVSGIFDSGFCCRPR